MVWRAGEDAGVVEVGGELEALAFALGAEGCFWVGRLLGGNWGEVWKAVGTRWRISWVRAGSILSGGCLGRGRWWVCWVWRWEAEIVEAREDGF